MKSTKTDKWLLFSSIQGSENPIFVLRTTYDL